LRINIDKSTVAQLSDETSITAYLTSLAANVVKGRLLATLYGNTVVNLLDDDVAGCESTSGWTTSNASVATDSSNEIEGTNCLKMTLTGSPGSIYRDVLSLLDTSKNYFISAHIKNNDIATSLKLQAQCIGDGGVITTNDSLGTTYNRIGVVIQASDFDTATQVYLVLRGEGSSTQYAFIDGLMLQEISSAEYALGADALLDKYAYHRGVKSSDRVRLKSVGKNLLPDDIFYKGYDLTYPPVEGDGTDTATYRHTGACFLDAGTYVGSQVSGSAIVWRVFGEVDGELTTSFDALSDTITLTVPQNVFFNFRRNDSATWDLGEKPSDFGLMVEKNSVATTNEPFTSTQAIAPIELHSVPDGTACSFNANSGLHTQRVQEYTLTEDDVTAIASGTNLQRVAVPLTTFSGIVTTTTNIEGVTLPSINSPEVSGSAGGYDGAGNENTHAVDANNLLFLFALGTYADLAAAKTALAGTKVWYKLATEVPTKYLPQTLIAEPNGTMIVSPTIKDNGVYDGGFSVSNEDYPISSLESVYKADPTTGLPQTPIAISTCTIDSDGLGFTSTALSDGDSVIAVYEHLYLSTIPTLTYQYPTNDIASREGAVDETGELDKKIEQHIQKEMVEQANIKFTPEGGLAVRMINKTGSDSVKGSVVSVSTTTADGVELQADEFDAFGIMYDNDVADGDYCWIVVSGIAQVLLKDTTTSTVGYWVIAADTDGRADATQPTPTPNNTLNEHTQHFKEIGHCMETQSSGTDVLAKCVLHFN